MARLLSAAPAGRRARAGGRPARLPVRAERVLPLAAGADGGVRLVEVDVLPADRLPAGNAILQHEVVGKPDRQPAGGERGPGRHELAVGHVAALAVEALAR